MIMKSACPAALLVVCLLAAAHPGATGEPADAPAQDSAAVTPAEPGCEFHARERTPAPAEAIPFNVGEKLTFSVRYEFVKAGEATLEVEDLTEFNGRPAYRFATVAKSTMPFSLVFEVEDRVESMMDAERLHSLRYEKNIKEGNYEKNDVIVFDQERHVAIYPGGKEVTLQPDALDVLSSLYYVRFLDLEVGRSLFIDNHADSKNYALEVKVLREETIEVPAGTFDCYVVEPILRAAGIFQHEGRLVVWLAKDHRHIPVKMESKIVIGAIKALLIRKEMGEGGSDD